MGAIPFILNVVFLFSLARITHAVLNRTPSVSLRARTLTLFVITMIYLFNTPYIFRHEDIRARAFCVGVPWLHALRLIDLMRNPRKAERMGRRSYKEFFAWINFNVETGAGPMKREELRKRLASRIARGLFKSFVFSALRSALTFIGSPDIALIWTKTAILSPQRHLIAVAMGVSLYLWIGALADVILGLAEFSMGIRMADVFDYSLCATSLRRFWGRQWNRPFQEALKNTVVLSDEEEAGGKTPGATMVQMFAVFIISGLFHDIINYRCFDTLSLTTVMFFVLQGAGCALEARIAHSHTYQRLPKVAKWAIVMGFLTLTGPLFVKPYILKGGMYAMPCPHF